MSFSCYASYRSSGMGWLGKIPREWVVTEGRRVFAQTRLPAHSDDEQLSATQKYGVIPQSSFMAYEGQRVVLALSGTAGFKHVDIDDFVISLRSFQGGIERCLYSGCVSPAYTVLKASCHIEPAYWSYLLKSETYIAALLAATDGIREGKTISYSQFGSIAVPVPTMSEQKRIAAFLKAETAKFDALVTEQRRLIELLKEKRQAVISYAVTKGLNPNVIMKDSGIEWLGDVPAHWEVKQLSRLARPGSTITYGIVQAGPDIEGGIPYIRTSDMAADHLSRDGYLRTSVEIDASYARSRVNTGDIVIAIRATIGKALMVPDFLNCANLTQGTAKFSPGMLCDANYMLYFLNSVATPWFDQVAKGATFKEITLDKLRKARVSCPPRDEQVKISRYLDAETAKLDQLMVQAARAIDLLQERRTALISAAVTGKIDVRGEIAISAATLKPYETGFARQLLAAEILHHCYDHPTTGRVKLQKLIHLCEYVAEIDEVHGDYLRKAAGPFDNTVMFGIASGLSKQKWFSQVKDGSRTVYRPLEKAGEHQKYLARWANKMPMVEKVLQLLGKAQTQQCEIVSTLYAAWNDLLIEGKSPTDAEIIHEASDAARWHENKAKIAPEKWPVALAWMREKELIPRGYGSHTKRVDSTPPVNSKSAKSRKGPHEPA